jgi:hypothetical protein
MRERSIRSPIFRNLGVSIPNDHATIQSLGWKMSRYIGAGNMPQMNRQAGKFALASTALIISSLGGCVVGGQTRLAKPTLGQELIDLQRAYADGVIDDHEYDETRSRILDRAGVVTSSVSLGPHAPVG